MPADQTPPDCKAYPIDTLTTGSGRREQWRYRTGYLYFENGVLAAIQKINS
jgi:hypothetical protein